MSVNLSDNPPKPSNAPLIPRFAIDKALVHYAPYRHILGSLSYGYLIYLGVMSNSPSVRGTQSSIQEQTQLQAIRAGATYVGNSVTQGAGTLAAYARENPTSLRVGVGKRKFLGIGCLPLRVVQEIAEGRCTGILDRPRGENEAEGLYI